MRTVSKLILQSGLFILSLPAVVVGFIFALLCHGWLMGVYVYGSLWED